MLYFSFDKANNENEDLINIFRVFDPNGKGSINVAELRYIWNNYLQEIAPDDSVSRTYSLHKRNKTTNTNVIT